MSVHPVADTDHEWRVQEGIALTTWIAPLSFCTGRRRDAARSRAAALDLRKRRPEMAEQFAHELSPAGLARSGAKRRWCRAPSLESHPARVARAAARRRHLGRGQPSVARHRGSADLARSVRCSARGRTAPRRGAGNRREYLAERRALLEGRLSEIAAKAAADRLDDVQIKGAELKITPLKAATPEEAKTLAHRLYRMMPNLRVTSLLAEVDRWTGFSGAFTHLQSGAPADDRRVVLTAVLADATNLGPTLMAEACSVASYRQLAWTAAWHLREETYRRALAISVNAQQEQPLCSPPIWRR